jgi:glucose/arabinose dehydrogenase
MKRTPRARTLLAIGAVCVLVGACAEPDASPTPGVTPTVAATSAPAQPSATASPSVASTPGPPATVPPVAADPPEVVLAAVGSGLDDPIGIAPAPGGRLLINERRGRVQLLDPASGDLELVLDIDDRVLGDGERGLLGLALHPDWPDDPRAFVHYTDGVGRTVVSTFAMTSAEPLRLDPASEAVLLRVDQPYANHNGGQLSFGPDGYLYLGLGDGGSGGDPLGHGQNRDTLLGSVLRLDVDAVPDGAGYAIPPENPFADGGGAPETFVYGLRNPWRLSFDRLTGELWIADVGQGAYEEVNRLDPATNAGANLGWNVMEGAHCYGAADCATDGLTLPLAEYGHDLGCSVTGGYVYRGEDVAGLSGWYLFSDYCSGLLFGVPSDADGVGIAPRVLAETELAVSAFGEDADGELYVADIASGTVYRIVEAG